MSSPAQLRCAHLFLLGAQEWLGVLHDLRAHNSLEHLLHALCGDHTAELDIPGASGTGAPLSETGATLSPELRRESRERLLEWALDQAKPVMRERYIHTDLFQVEAAGTALICARDLLEQAGEDTAAEAVTDLIMRANGWCEPALVISGSDGRPLLGAVEPSADQLAELEQIFFRLLANHP